MRLIHQILMMLINHFTYRWNNDVYMDAAAGLSYYLARSGVQAEEEK